MLVAACVLGLAAPSLAQTETGRITGTITDQSGAVVPGVTVTAKSTGTGASRTVVTDEAGHYVFANLTPGAYEISAELQGFQPAQSKVTLTVGGVANVDLRLGVAGTTEAVTVVAETPPINTVNAEIATSVSERQIRELPTITRNVYDLVSIAGNVSAEPTDAQSRGTGFTINGQRSAGTNILLDGSANNDEFSATVGQAVPLDSVQEFSVITSNFSAQYGRASGGIVNVATKAGTNAFRGTAYDFFRNDKLATNTFDNKSRDIQKGEFERHQMGFSLGGPVQRDKVHFFSNLEYIRVRSADTLIGWVPTQEFLSASSPLTQQFFQAYGGLPSPNGPVLTRSDVSNLVGTGSGPFNSLPAGMPIFGQVQKSLPIDAGGGDPQDNYQWVSRVDFALNNNTQMYVRYAYQNQETEPGTVSASVFEGFDTGQVNRNHNILGSLTHVFGNSFTTQSKVVWNRLLNEQPLNGEPQPTLYMNPTGVVNLQGQPIMLPGYLPNGPGTAIPFGGPQQLLQLYQDQTWLKGAHDMRFGGSFVRINDERTFGAFANAVASLNSQAAALPALDNFVLGQLAQFQVAINPQGFPGGTYTTPVQLPSFTSNNYYNEFALYFNDNWSVRDRLTLNLGLRYEYFGPQKKSEPKYDSNFYYPSDDISVNTSTPEQIIRALQGGTVLPSNESPIGSLWKSDKNNFAPRVGFAYDLFGDGRTSLRGGYGIGYERNFGNVTYNVLFNPPQYLVATILVPTDVSSIPISTDPAGPFGGVAGVTKTIPGGSLRHVDQNIETAYAHFYGASIQHQLGTGLVANLEYTGSSGRKLYDLADPNKPGATLVYLGEGTATSRPNTRYTAFNTRGNRGRSQYHGVTLGLDARDIWQTGLQMSLRYTLGNAKDNLSNTFSEGNNGQFNLGYLDPFDPDLDYGAAEFDVRHRLAWSGIWELPFGRDAGGVLEAIAGGWQLNWILTARSGYPFTLFDCTNGFVVCMRAQDPVGIDRNATSGPPSGNPNEFNLLDIRALHPFVGGYVNPLTGTSDYGPYPADMLERNAMRGPGFWNVDFGLSKRVRFGGTRAVQFRLEAYNLFNHANMFTVQGFPAQDVSSDFLTGFKDGNRRVQLGFKFEF
jgi:outer membrane receptor protein involved in Fe transport